MEQNKISEAEKKGELLHADIMAAAEDILSRNVNHPMTPELATGIYTVLAASVKKILANHLKPAKKQPRSGKNHGNNDGENQHP